MAGLDPRTGERLVEPKLAVFDDAKVALAPLVDAVEAAAVARGVHPDGLFVSVKGGRAYGRAVRAVVNDGDAAMLRADDAGRVADAAGLDVEAVWGAGVYAAAVGNLTETKTVSGADGNRVERLVPRRRVVGNMGYDVSFTLPKSHSLLLAFADETTAAGIEAVYTAQVGATFDWLEGQTAYGMRGHHGEGKSARTVRGSGFLGWSMVHRAARPVGDRVVGDPHWHVHVTVANMTRGVDGGWSTVAAGGRDLMRHAPAADHVLKALVRRRLSEQFGVTFARSERTGAWEVAAIDDATLRAFSKRGASIEAMLRDLGFDPALATRRAEDLAAAQTRHDKTEATAAPDATLRSIWQAEARTLGVDPDRLAAAALPGPANGGGQPTEQNQQQQDQERLLADVVGRLTDPERGLTSGRRRFTRIDALAAVADALPAGAADVAEVEGLCDRALAAAGIVPLPDPPGAKQTIAPASGLEPAAGQQQAQDQDGHLLAAAGNAARRQIGAGHMANAARFTTADVVAAERAILTAAAGSRPGQGAAHVTAGTAALARQAVEAGQGFALSAEQAAVVERLVTGDRMLDAVLGPPGTGKTTLMRAARTAWEAGGYTVVGAATAAVAAQNLGLESGIASRTVAQWVYRIRTGEGLSGVDVLVLDEANLTDDRDRAALYQAAARSGTKLVEVGDPRQLRGVGCGSLFARVHELVGGMELTENRRQAEQDERAAIAAWRDGRYTQALSSWAGRGRLVATETGDQAVTAMVASWMAQRAGAPDAHAEMRGVVMLAAANDTVERLNDAAQAVRAAAGELGPEHVYAVKGGRSLRLRAGDHVLVRLNYRAQRMHEGPDVLNGYRGVVEHIDTGPGGDRAHGGDGAVRVAWQQHGPDGLVTHRATLSAEFVAGGGLSLGYAMTGHKAEGLTVAADWALADGARQGGTVLVHAAGMDEPGLHVATSRHRDKVILFAGRDQLETPADTHELGIPTTDRQLERRVVAGLAEQARTRSANANDTPVHDDLGRGPGRRGTERDPDLPPGIEPGTELAAQWARLLERTRPAAQLREAWSEQARAAEQLATLEPRLAAARADAARERRAEQALAPLRDQLETARTALQVAEQATGPAEQGLAGRAGQIAAELSQAWEDQRPAAREAAKRVQAGPGRLGLRRGQVRAAQAHLDQWANTWRPVLGESRLPAGRVVEFAAAHPANDQVQRPITGYARAQARLSCPSRPGCWPPPTRPVKTPTPPPRPTPRPRPQPGTGWASSAPPAATGTWPGTWTGSRGRPGPPGLAWRGPPNGLPPAPPTRRSPASRTRKVSWPVPTPPGPETTRPPSRLPAKPPQPLRHNKPPATTHPATTTDPATRPDGATVPASGAEHSHLSSAESRWFQARRRANRCTPRGRAASARSRLYRRCTAVQLLPVPLRALRASGDRWFLADSRHAELVANGPRGAQRQLSMTRHAAAPTVLRVAPDAVPAALPVQRAAMGSQVAFQISQADQLCPVLLVRAIMRGGQRYRVQVTSGLSYTAVFEPVEDGWVQARLAGLPGVITAAPTQDEAQELLLDALREYLLSLIEPSDAYSAPVGGRRIDVELRAS